MLVSVARPKQAIYPTQTATLKFPVTSTPSLGRRCWKILEDDRGHGEAKFARCPDRFHAGEPLQAHREGVGDLVLDLLRAASLPVGPDDDLVFREIRNRIHGRAIDAIDAPEAHGG